MLLPPNTSLVRVLHRRTGTSPGPCSATPGWPRTTSGAVAPRADPGHRTRGGLRHHPRRHRPGPAAGLAAGHLSDASGIDHRGRARPGRGQHLRRRRRDARPVDGGGRARRRQAGRPGHRPAAHRPGPRPPTRTSTIMPYEGLNSAYFRHAPADRGADAPPRPSGAAARRSRSPWPTAEEQAVAESDRCMSCGVCNGCDNCYIVCPDVSVLRDARENGHYSIRTTYCKGCLVCVQECPTGCLEKVPEMDFDAPEDVTRMETAFAPYDGAHAEQSAFTKQLIEDTIAEYDAARASPCRRRPAPNGHPPTARARTSTPKSPQRRTPAGSGHDHGRMSKGPGASEPAYGPGLRTPAGEQRLGELAGTRKRLNGCAAAAYAALYANVDVITAYPIRPYTAIMMNLAQFIADGILDAEYMHADGEHSQLSAAFGAGSCGARAFTGSSGVGVTYAYEMYSIISGARIPIQMADRRPHPGPAGRLRVRAHRRAVHQGHGLADGLGGHPAGGVRQDAARLRDRRGPAGAAAADGGAGRLLRLAHRGRGGDAAAPPRWTTFLPPYRLPFPLDPRQPVSHGPQIHPSQGPPLQLERARAMEDAIPVIREKTDEFARVFGRHVPALRGGVPAGGRGDRDRHLRRPLGHLPGRDQPAPRAGHQDRHGPAAVDPAVPQRRPARTRCAG